jgi:hypothetical protein
MSHHHHRAELLLRVLEGQHLHYTSHHSHPSTDARHSAPLLTAKDDQLLTDHVNAPPSKRRRTSAPFNAATPSTHTTDSDSPSTSSHPLISSLHPVRLLLHAFLTDDDGARLLRVSRTTALSLLAGFTFQQHVFLGDSQLQLQRMTALYEAYDVRPTRMCLSFAASPLTFDHSTGRSPLPSSLQSLVLGPLPRAPNGSFNTATMFDPHVPALCEAIFAPGRGAPKGRRHRTRSASSCWERGA